MSFVTLSEELITLSCNSVCVIGVTCIPQCFRHTLTVVINQITYMSYKPDVSRWFYTMSAMLLFCSWIHLEGLLLLHLLQTSDFWSQKKPSLIHLLIVLCLVVICLFRRWAVFIISLRLSLFFFKHITYHSQRDELQVWSGNMINDWTAHWRLRVFRWC